MEARNKKGQPTKKRTILRIVLMVVISLVFGFGLYSCNAETISGDSMPMPFGIGAGVVMSGSMEPYLSVDDLIIVKKASKYKQGDWVVFQQRRMLVVHEVISIDYEQGIVITKGSANDVADEPMSIRYIKGKVIKHYDGVGKAISFFKSPIVMMIIIAIAVLLLYKSYQSEGKKEEVAQTEQEIEKIKQEIELLKSGSTPVNPEQSADGKQTTLDKQQNSDE